VTEQQGTSVNRQVFTGQEHDENTNLIYFGARYYDPDAARFINQDSYLGEISTPPSLHRYLYAYANPTVYTDPDGHKVLDPLENALREGAQDAITEGIEVQEDVDRQRNTAFVDPFNPNAKPFAEMAGYQAAGYDILADVVGVVDFGINIAGILANKVGLVSDEVAVEMTKENEEGVQKLVGETVTSVLNFKQTANEINQLRQDAKAGNAQAIAALARLEGNVVGGAAIGGVAGGSGVARGVSRGVSNGLRNVGRGLRKNGKAPDKNTVTVYRVDDNAFEPRISGGGEIPVVTTKKGNERALFVNIDQPQRAKEFALVNRNGNATITAVEADASLLEKLRNQSVFDKSEAASLNPTAPLRVDIHKAPDQFGLRTPEQIQMLRDAIDPSTVRIIDPDDL
jgi:RHS repeat-associated protein